jgi:PleD family two-component response regulator
MRKQESKKILAAVEDLFFTVKISDAAKRAGLNVEFVKSDNDLVQKARDDNPLLIILDLNNNSVQPLKVASKLKGSSELKHISLLGYVSHVQGDLKQKAHEVGCDMVLARSAFSQNLSLILKRHAGVI